MYMYIIFMLIIMVSCGTQPKSNNNSSELAPQKQPEYTWEKPFKRVPNRDNLFTYLNRYYLVLDTESHISFKDAYKACFDAKDSTISGSWSLPTDKEMRDLIYLVDDTFTKQYWTLEHNTVSFMNGITFNFANLQTNSTNYYVCIGPGSKKDISFEVPKISFVKGLSGIGVSPHTSTEFVFESDLPLDSADCNLVAAEGDTEPKKLYCKIENKTKITMTVDDPYSSIWDVKIKAFSEAGIATDFLYSFEIYDYTPNLYLKTPTEDNLKYAKSNILSRGIKKIYNFSFSDFNFYYFKLDSITLDIDGEIKTIKEGLSVNYFLTQGTKKMKYYATSVGGKKSDIHEFSWTIYYPYDVDKISKLLVKMDTGQVFTPVLKTDVLAADSNQPCSNLGYRLPTYQELNNIQLPPDYFTYLGSYPNLAWARTGSTLVQGYISGLAYEYPLSNTIRSSVICTSEYNW